MSEQGLEKPLQQYDSCVLWLEGFKSEGTKTNYTRDLRLFCRFYSITPDQLIAFQVPEIKEKVLKCIVHLKHVAKKQGGKKKGRGEISVNSIRTYLTGVHSFLDFHEVPINWKKIDAYFPEEVNSDITAYTREEIAKMLQFADVRDRVVILIMVSGGPRVGALPSIKLKHITKIDDTGISALKLYPESKRDHYNTLLTPECVRAIDEWLEWRKNHGEKLGPESLLIRDKYAAFSSRTNRAKPIQSAAIRMMIKRVIKRAGIDDHDLNPDHSFRYFFNTTLKNSRVTPDFKSLLMGHDTKLDENYYDETNPESRQVILEEYLKAVDALTINNENRLRRENLKLKEKVDDIALVKERLAKQEQGFKQYKHDLGRLLLDTIRKNDDEDCVEPTYLEAMHSIIRFVNEHNEEKKSSEEAKL